MFSLRLPIPLKMTLTPPPKASHAPSSYPHSPHSHYFYNPYNSCSQSQRLIVPKRRTATAPPNMALRDEAGDGTLPVRETPEPLPVELVPELMPKHVAVIMDGHGRWAKMRGLSPSAGHQAMVEPFRRIVKLCGSWGIKVLTILAFSTENWFRPKEEVDFLMRLFERAMFTEIETYMREGIRISVIGDSSKLPDSLKRKIASAEETTKNNTKLQLILAVNYSGKYDILQACKSVAKKVQDGQLHLEDINESNIEQELETKCTEFPYPDLHIRTSGELRISNSMFWQLAYTELYFSRKLWPDFGKDDFVDALTSFQQRQRRYGGRY